MVDLVKIRKKAKEKKKEEAAAASEQAAAGQTAPDETSDQTSAQATSDQTPAPLERPQPARVAPKALVASAGSTAHPKSAAEDTSASLSAGSGAPKAKRAAEDTSASASAGSGPPNALPAVPSTSKLTRFLETAGKKRELEVRKEVEAAGEQIEVLTFSMAGENYAIGIEGVVIITPRPVTRVPNADPSVVGILSLRGTIIVILDARARLNLPPAGEPDLDTRIVVVERNGESAGFFVDRVDRVIKVAASDVQPHPVAHASEQHETIRGVFRHGEALTILLDLDKLLERGVAASVP